MSPALPEGETYNKYKFLNNYLSFFHGHWGNYWHMEKHPEVYLISFYENMDSAKVYFRIGYEGGEGILANNEGNWTLIDSYLTWIE